MIEDNFYMPFASEKITDDMKSKAIKSIDEYYKINYSDFEKIQFSEKNIELDLGNNIRVNGRIDPVKWLDKETLNNIIVDFKTANRPLDQEVSEEQLKIYALGFKALTGEDAQFIEFYNLDKNQQDRKRLINEDLEKTADKIREAANNIRSNKMVKQCEPTKCDNCYIKYLCYKR